METFDAPVDTSDEVMPRKRPVLLDQPAFNRNRLNAEKLLVPMMI
jgi:hypothetical protein